MASASLNPLKIAGRRLPEPKSENNASSWSPEVEEAYRFQVAGYRSIEEYMATTGLQVERWQHNNFVKKLKKRGSECWNYFDKERECAEKDIEYVTVYRY